MGNFRRDNRGGRRNYGQRDFGRPRFGDRRDRQMHKTICSNCGKDCEVPFVPTGEKPVFCSDCFEKRGGGSDSRRFEDRGPRRPNFEGNMKPQNNLQLEAINTKLDKILAILESTSVKPAEEPKIEKEIEIQPEKPIVVVKKKTKVSKKIASTKEEQL